MRRSVSSYVGAADVAHRHLADVREYVPPQARHPVLRMPRMAPAGVLALPDPLGGVREGGDAVGAAFLRQRVAAVAGHLTVGEGLGARFGERDEREAAESQFSPPALDHEPLDPIPRASGMNLDVKAVAITATATGCPLSSMDVPYMP